MDIKAIKAKDKTTGVESLYSLEDASAREDATKALSALEGVFGIGNTDEPDVSELTTIALVENNTIHTMNLGDLMDYLARSGFQTDDTTALTSMEELSVWQFSKDNTNWSSVTLPHTCNASDGLSSSMYKGITYYRTELPMIKTVNRRSYLACRAMGQQAAIYVNDVLVGEKFDGYTPCIVDITDAYIEGTNVIRIECDNTKSADRIPMSADFNFNNGLHEKVYLYQMNKVGFDPENYGIDRVHVDCLVTDNTSATLTLKFGIVNQLAREVKLTIQGKVGDVTGEKQVTIPASQTVVHETLTITVPNPTLWNGKKNPYLYDVSMNLLYLGKSTDTVSIKYGIRYFSMDPTNGFMLNGEAYPLRGVALHQDGPDHMSAMTISDFDRDYDMIMDVGATFVRQAHYTHDKYAVNKCDELGLVVQTEIPWVNHIGPNATEAYHNSIEQALRSMIKNYYNHPSIIFWGLSNELNGSHWSGTDPQGGFSAALAVEWNNEFYDLAKSLDSSRFIGATTHDSTFNGSSISQWKKDFFATNQYKGWYGYTFDDFGTRMDSYKSQFDFWGVGEYGAGSNPTTHSENPMTTTNTSSGGARHDEEYQNLFHEAYVEQIQARPWLVYTAIWAMFDFAVAGRNEGGTPYHNDKGIVTRDRQTRKDAYYLYKSLWSSDPVVYITSRRFSTRPSDYLPIKVYSNATSLTMYRDGEEIQTLNSPTKAGVVWEFDQINFILQNHTIRVVGTFDSGTTEDIVAFSTEIDVSGESDTVTDYYDYVQSSGGVYINTNYKPTAATSMEITIGFSSGDAGAVFGSRTSSTSTDRFAIYTRLTTTPATLNFMHGNTDTGDQSLVASEDGIYTFTLSNTTATVNDQSWTYNDHTFNTTNYPIYLLGYNQAGAQSHLLSKPAYIYEVKIFENNELVRYWRPTIDFTTGDVRLYDIITNTSIQLDSTHFTPSETMDICLPSKTLIDVTSEAGAETINVATYKSLRVICNDDWVHPSIDGHSITFSYDENTKDEVRSAKIRILAGLACRDIVINQDESSKTSEIYTERLACLISDPDTHPYILTDIMGEIDTDVRIEVQCSSTSGSGAIFGARNSTSQSRMDLIRSASNNSWTYIIANDLGINNNTFSSRTNSIDDDVHDIIIYNDQYISVDGEVFYAQMPDNKVGIIHLNFPLALFADNTSGVMANVSGTRTIYYLRWYHRNVLIHNFIPVLDLNGDACMYDTVDRKFLYAANEASFGYKRMSEMVEGVVTIVDDDAREFFHDYTAINGLSNTLEGTEGFTESFEEIYDEFGYRPTLGVVSSWVDAGTGTNSDATTFPVMSLETLQALKAKGYDFLNHSTTHNLAWRNNTITQDEIYTEVDTAYQWMVDNGFDIGSGFVYPWGNYSSLRLQYTKNAISKYYDYGINIDGNTLIDASTDPWLLPRRSLTDSTVSQVEAAMLSAKNSGKWLIILSHARFDTLGAVSPDSIRLVLQFAKDNNIAIKTFNEVIASNASYVPPTRDASATMAEEAEMMNQEASELLSLLSDKDNEKEYYIDMNE